MRLELNVIRNTLCPVVIARNIPFPFLFSFLSSVMLLFPLPATLFHFSAPSTNPRTCRRVASMELITNESSQHSSAQWDYQHGLSKRRDAVPWIFESHPDQKEEAQATKTTQSGNWIEHRRLLLFLLIPPGGWLRISRYIFG